MGNHLRQGGRIVAEAKRPPHERLRIEVPLIEAVDFGIVELLFGGAQVLVGAGAGWSKTGGSSDSGLARASDEVSASAAPASQ